MVGGWIGIVWLLFIMLGVAFGEADSDLLVPSEFWIVAWLAVGVVLLGTAILGKTSSFWGALVAATGFFGFVAWFVLSPLATDPRWDAFLVPLLVIGFVEAAIAAVLFVRRPRAATPA